MNKPPVLFFDDDSDGAGIEGEALVFIECVNDAFKVNEEAIQFLNSLEGSISVVSVAGMYRTGKSFLLNRILLNAPANNGFQVGNTTRACTRGVWIWKHPIVYKDINGKDVNILICDSEGLGAPTADASHDTRIFALALLLSSYFIYNSLGTIDEQALSNLSLVTNISKEIRVSSSSDDNDISQFLPAFHWVVRDFSLQMMDANGKQIHSKEYLEDALKDVTEGKSIKAKNKIRSALRTYFPIRDCVCLVRPCVDETNLQNLDKLPLTSLRPEFVEHAVSFREKVFQSASNRPNQLNGVMLTGSMLSQLAVAYVAAINDGKVPVIQDAWSYMCNEQRSKANEKLVLEFHTRCGELCNASLAPYQFVSSVGVLKNELLEKFKKSCVGVTCENELQKLTSTFVSNLEDKNYISQNILKYLMVLKNTTTTVFEGIEEKIHALNDFSELRQLIETKYTSNFQEQYIEPLCNESETNKILYTDQANGVWYRNVTLLLYKFIPQFYGAREQMLSSIKTSLERAENRLMEVVKANEQQITELKSLNKAEMDKLELDCNQVIAHLTEENTDSKEFCISLQTKITTLENELQVNTSTTLDSVAAIQQELENEKMKTVALTKEVEHLNEELNDVEGNSEIFEEQTKEITILAFERDRLTKENSDLKRTITDQKRTINSIETTVREEAKTMQTKALQSLQQM